MIGLLYPKFLLMAIPAIVLLLLILKLDFLRAKEDDFRRDERRRVKYFLMVFRIIIILCLFFALATPFTELEIAQHGPPKLTILIDQSQSMELFETDIAALTEILEKEVPVRVAYIGRNQSSNIGEGILSNLEEESNILLITDGYSNRGINLGDVMFEAAAINASISALFLKPKHPDASVLIVGDAKTFTEVEYEFEVRLYRSNIETVNLIVTIDDKIIFDKKTTEEVVKFTEKFTPGMHKISARIKEEDYFSENNAFFKSLRVIDKPKLLLVSEKT